MSPFLLCLSSKLYFWLQWIARETFRWEVVIAKPALCSELSNVQQGSNRSPHPALRSASASRKELTSLCYQKEAAEFDLMPLIFFKICTDCLSRFTSLSKLNLSTKWLGFDLCCEIVKFPTKPLAFCRGELIEEHLVFYFWGYFFQAQFTWPKAQENDGILFVTLHGRPCIAFCQ